MPLGRGIDNAGWSGADYTSAGYSPASGRGAGTATGNVWGGGGASAPRYTDTYSGAPQTPATAGSVVPPNTGGSGGAGSNPGVSPWMSNVWGSLNGNQVDFATPNNPNVNYITQDAANNLGRLFGANVVEQNRQNMASPGSIAPSAPMYGLDFGYGGPQNAGQVQFWLDRGDSVDQIKSRLSAGLNNTGWGGPAPNVNYDTLWNMKTPISTNQTQSWAAPIAPQNANGFDTWLQNRNNQPSIQTSAPQYPVQNQQAAGNQNQTPSGVDMNSLMNYLAAIMLGGGMLRRPQLSGGNNLLTNYYYPSSEPNFGG